nr:hypothetical protein [Glutamicibacter nicotianae]
MEIHDTAERIAEAAASGASIAHRENPRMTAAAITNTRQLTLAPGCSMSSQGPLLSSVLVIGALNSSASGFLGFLLTPNLLRSTVGFGFSSGSGDVLLCSAIMSSLKSWCNHGSGSPRPPVLRHSLGGRVAPSARPWSSVYLCSA